MFNIIKKVKKMPNHEKYVRTGRIISMGKGMNRFGRRKEAAINRKIYSKLSK